jgi:hypothetical protein
MSQSKVVINSKAARELSEGGDAEPLVAGEDPCWAPNSRTVIFMRRVNYNKVLSLLDVPTKHVKDVEQISGSCSQPAWAGRIRALVAAMLIRPPRLPPCTPAQPHAKDAPDGEKEKEGDARRIARPPLAAAESE